ncbi:MAG: hypothetical protein ABW277_23105 [Longimicrobiaceae bacterium]
MLDRFNLAGCPLQTFEFVESASEDAEREEMNRQLERIESGRVGVILGGYGSRLARDEEFGARLVKAAARHDVQFVVGGAPYNPRNPDERAKLMDMFVIARRENAERIRILLTGRLYKAREKQLMIGLPTGLMWVDPQNPAYRSLMEREGLMRHLQEAQLKHHLVKNPQERAVLHILPDPFKDVYRACEMVTQWIRETLDPTEVLHRVRTDARYPRRGLFPCHRSSVFGKSNGPQWHDLTGDRLRKWIDSPALFGNYVSRSPFLYGVGEAEDSEFVVEDAFPSFLRPEDYDVVMAAFSDGKRKFETGMWAGPRIHVLSNVRCSERLPSGKVCNAKISATSYRQDGVYRYTGVKCHAKGHKGHLPTTAEPMILKVLEQVFRPEAFAKIAEQIRRTVEINRHRRAELRATIEGLEEDIDFFAEQQLAGHKAANQDEEAFWSKRRRAAMDQHRVAREELVRMESREQQIRDLKEEEFKRIRQLATDVPLLLRRARQLDLDNVRRFQAGEMKPGEPMPQGFLRRIVNQLIRVVRVKHVGRGAYALQMVFPSGTTVTQVLVSKAGVGGATAEQELWAAEQLRLGRDATHVARDLEMAHDRSGYRPWGMQAWDAERVQLAALHAQYGARDVSPAGTYETLDGLAERIGEPVDLVQAITLAGRLGRAIAIRGGLAVSPTIEQLDEEFPEYARRRAAATCGWPVEDTRTLVELGEKLSSDLCSLAKRAETYGSGVAFDSLRRRYARESEVDFETVTAEIALRAAPAEYRELPIEHWLRTREALGLLPGVTELQLQKHTASFLAGRDRWYFMPPEVVAALYVPTLEEAAMAEGLDPAHFVDHRRICSYLQVRFGLEYAHCTVSMWGQTAFVRVHVRIPEESRHKRLFVYIPDPVRNSSDPEVARSWLRGELSSAR